MKFQYIRAAVRPAGKRYFFPACVTRYYYRRNFYLDSLPERAEITVDYPFAFEVYCNGVRCACEAGQSALLSGLSKGLNRLAVKTYLSNDPMRFTPALSVSLTAEGKCLIQPDEEWLGFTFAAFYTQAEDEDWFVKDYPDDYKFYTLHDAHPTEIKRSHYFRRSFRVDGSVAGARLYASAKGMFVPYLNGAEAGGKGALLPGVVQAPENGFPYKSQSSDHYRTFDVTLLLIQGENVLAFLTGNGWYVSEGFNTMRILPNELAAVLEIDYADGRRERISTDGSWLTHPSHYLENDLQWGARVDLGAEITGWNCPECDLSDWTTALPCGEAELEEQSFPGIETVETVAPAAVLTGQRGIVFDFGENLTGRAELSLQDVRPGQTVLLFYGEKRREDGTLTGGPYHDVFFALDTHEGGIAGYGARNLDAVRCGGQPNPVFRPEFAFTGFRYVEVVGADREQIAGICARRMRSAVRPTLEFHASNPLLEEICALSVRSYFGNLMDGPIDCPTREKNYWNGDACIIASTQFYLADGHALMRYWTTEGRKIDSDAAGWRDECYETPYQLYRFYGDAEVLRVNYGKLCQLADQRAGACRDGIYCGEEVTFFGDHGMPEGCPNMDRRVYSHSFYALSLLRRAEIAALIGRTEDVEPAKARLEAARRAFSEILYPQLLSLEAGANLGNLILPVVMGLTDGEQTQALGRELIRRVRDLEGKVWCGAVACAHLLPLLCELGESGLAERVALCTEYPSWGYICKSGATTMTEYWGGMDSNEEGDSLNHYFRGAIVRWLIEYVAGIRPGAPGFKRVELAPVFLPGLKSCSCRYDSPCGKIAVDWKCTDEGVSLRVESAVPGVVRLPFAAAGVESGERLADRWRYELPAGVSEWRAL